MLLVSGNKSRMRGPVPFEVRSLTVQKDPHLRYLMKTRCHKLMGLAMLLIMLPLNAAAQMVFRIDTSGNILEQSSTILDHDTESITGTQWTLLEGNTIIRNGSTHSVTGLPEGVMLQRIAAENATSSFVFGDDSQAYLVDETGAVTYSTNSIRDFDTNPFNNDTWTLYTLSNLLKRNNDMVYVEGLPDGVIVERLVAWDANTVYLFADNGYSYSIENNGTITGITDGIFDETVGPSGSPKWTLYTVNNFILLNRSTAVYVDGLPGNTTLHRISAFDSTSAYVFAIPEPRYLTFAGIVFIATLLLRRSKKSRTRHG